MDRHLFFSSAVMQVGDGRDTLFWEARWLHGHAPKELAPELFKIAMFKHRSIHAELQNLNWIRIMQEINNVSQLEEFTNLFMALSSIILSQDKDQIYWNWTGDGKFTVAYAYECQFWGSMSTFKPDVLWKAHVEPKCRFLSWLVLHDRVLTTDNMAKRNWHYNPLCPLCYCIPETSSHPLAHCNYAKATWNLVASHFSLPLYPTLANLSGPADWMQLLYNKGTKEEKKRNVGILINF
jgi:hypothetical protein